MADAYNHRIRKIDIQQRVSTVAGTGASGTTTGGYANGDTSAARFNVPTEVFVDTINNVLYISDTFNNRVRKVSLANSMVTNYAGNGAASFTNAIDSLAAFNFTRGIAMDSSRQKLFVADFNNHSVRLIAPMTNGMMETNNVNDFVVYPNPSESLFTIKCSKGFNSVEIYDASLQQIKEEKTSSHTETIIDLSAYPKGTYFAKVLYTKEKEFSWIRLIKN